MPWFDIHLFDSFYDQNALKKAKPNDGFEHINGDIIVENILKVKIL